MARSEKLIRKIEKLNQALTSALNLFSKDLAQIKDEALLDGIKNGQIQKFEYCIELFWKTMRSLLNDEKGLNVNGSKDTIRELAKFTKLSPTEIEQLLEMVDDRNALSHEYEESIFSTIYPKLNGHLLLIKKALSQYK